MKSSSSKQKKLFCKIISFEARELKSTAGLALFTTVTNTEIQCHIIIGARFYSAQNFKNTVDFWVFCSFAGQVPEIAREVDKGTREEISG